MKPQFVYRAIVRSVYDEADPAIVRCDIDLGMSTWIINEPVRLARIDSPEESGLGREDGLESHEVLKDWIEDKEVIIQTYVNDRGKFGRYTAEIWLDSPSGWVNINDRLVSAGLAIYEHY